MSEQSDDWVVDMLGVLSPPAVVSIDPVLLNNKYQSVC